MFWTLLLAHLIADYPLQPSRLVDAKRRYSGLTVHVAVHFLVMLALLWPSWRVVWPYALLLTLIHFGIDAFKNLVSIRFPDRVVEGYLFDQLLHFISILLVAALIERSIPDVATLIPAPWSVYAVGLLLATYVWFVTERVLYYADAAFRDEIVTHMWSRMLFRGALLATLVVAFLSMGAWISGAILATASSGGYRRRALINDFLVALCVAILIVKFT